MENNHAKNQCIEMMNTIQDRLNVISSYVANIKFENLNVAATLSDLNSTNLQLSNIMNLLQVQLKDEMQEYVNECMNIMNTRTKYNQKKIDKLKSNFEALYNDNSSIEDALNNILMNDFYFTE